MNFKRILVTGGTGFLGRHVVGKLAEEQVEVHSCSRREGVDLREVESFSSFLEELKPDCVVHCAAHVGGLAYVQQHAVEVFEDNLRIALGLLQGLSRAGFPYLLNIMPNCTYPGDKEIYREPEWWDGPMHPSVLMYGLPRKTLWGLAQTYAREQGLHSDHLILPNLYGPYDHFDAEKSHALGALVAKVVQARNQNERKVPLWGTGRPVREWLHVGDAAEAICKFLKVAQPDSDHSSTSAEGDHTAPILNVGVGQGVTILDLARQIQTAAGWEGEFELDPDKPDGAHQKLIDGQQFAGLTGWAPAISLADGIKQTVAWYSEHIVGETGRGH